MGAVISLEQYRIYRARSRKATTPPTPQAEAVIRIGDLQFRIGRAPSPKDPRPDA